MSKYSGYVVAFLIGVIVGGSTYPAVWLYWTLVTFYEAFEEQADLTMWAG
jgi:hypothetical protein